MKLIPFVCCLCLVSVATGAEKIRVLVWDEQQPEQKQAYGARYLGETIAAHLQQRPDLDVRTAALGDADQGLEAEAVNQTDVLIFWCHGRARELKDDRAEHVVKRVMDGKLSLIALHSAHWAKPFVRLMQERTKADALASIPESERATAKWEFLNDQPYGKVLPKEEPVTPSMKKVGDVYQVTLPQCVFPAYRPDGAPSHVTTLLPKHAIAAGLPEKWDIPQTEMYSEPFHVPAPDEVVFEEQWDKGEHFRSGCVWKVGKGKVFYFRPGHEIYPVYKQPETLRVMENATRWLANREPK